MTTTTSMIHAQPATSPDTQTHRTKYRLLVSIAWPVFLIGAVYLTIAHIGFQPTDEGNVLGQTYRLLSGEVPHRDVIFARPMGSSFLHMIDFMIPMPLFEAARLIGIAEFAGYSLLFAWLVFDLSPPRWGPVRVLAAGGSVLVNMHTFFLSGWYTTDGLLFTAAGFVALRAGLSSERRWLQRLGLLSAGTAVLMKQSFLLASVALLVWVLWDGRARPIREQVRRAAEAAFFLAIPILVYVSALAVLGGLGDFLRQIFGARAVWGAELVTDFAKRGPRGELFLFLSTLLGLLVLRSLSRAATAHLQRRGRRGWAAGTTLIDLMIRACITSMVLGLVLHHRFAYGGSWASILMWGVVLVVAWRAIAERTFDGPGVLLALTAWMTSLSWGYALPNLVAGSAGLYIVDRAWRGIVVEPVIARPALRIAFVSTRVVLAAVAVSMIGASFLDARHDKPYFSPPRAELTADLAAASPDFGHIVTSPSNARYLAELARCVRSNPARWTAVLPDNPGMYAALRLRNPFPIDWMFPAEVEGQEARILHATRRLDASGDYTVLFQTFSAGLLRQSRPIPSAGPRSRIVSSPLLARIWDSLHGRRFTCGYFRGVTAPARQS